MDEPRDKMSAAAAGVALREIAIGVSFVNA
jgi:hypothetical protein